MKRCTNCKRFGVEYDTQTDKEKCLWINEKDIDLDAYDYGVNFVDFRNSINIKREMAVYIPYNNKIGINVRHDKIMKIVKRYKHYIDNLKLEYKLVLNTILANDLKDLSNIEMIIFNFEIRNEGI